MLSLTKLRATRPHNGEILSNAATNPPCLRGMLAGWLEGGIDRGSVCSMWMVYVFRVHSKEGQERAKGRERGGPTVDI